MDLADKTALQAADFGPVVLTYADQPLWVVPGRPMAMMHLEQFETNEEAIQRACALVKTHRFHVPSISIPNGTACTFGTVELLDECARRLS